MGHTVDPVHHEPTKAEGDRAPSSTATAKHYTPDEVALREEDEEVASIETDQKPITTAQKKKSQQSRPDEHRIIRNEVVVVPEGGDAKNPSPRG